MRAELSTKAREARVDVVIVKEGGQKAKEGGVLDEGRGHARGRRRAGHLSIRGLAREHCPIFCHFFECETL